MIDSECLINSPIHLIDCPINPSTHPPTLSAGHQRPGAPGHGASQGLAGEHVRFSLPCRPPRQCTRYASHPPTHPPTKTHSPLPSHPPTHQNPLSFSHPPTPPPTHPPTHPPETTLAVAEFVTVVCHALAQENAAYSRERVAQLSPFEPMGPGGLEEEDGLKKPGKMRVVMKEEDGEKLEWDEELVLGRRRAKTEEEEEEEEGDESKTTASTTTPSSRRVMGEGGEEEEEEEEVENLFPIQQDSMRGAAAAEHDRFEQEDKALLVKRLVEGILVGTVGGWVDE